MQTPWFSLGRFSRLKNRPGALVNELALGTWKSTSVCTVEAICEKKMRIERKLCGKEWLGGGRREYREGYIRDERWRKNWVEFEREGGLD